MWGHLAIVLILNYVKLVFLKKEREEESLVGMYCFLVVHGDENESTLTSGSHGC